MSDLVNVNPIVGRKFVAKSNNVATVRKLLGEGGVTIGWNAPPTDQDIEEFNLWAQSILGELEITTHKGGKRSEGAIEKATIAYKDWLRKQK